MKLAAKLLVLVPFALGSVGACSDETIESERVDHSQSAVASVVTFDNPAPPGSPDTALGTFGGIVWGSGWFWSGPYASNSTNHAYFSADVTSRSFSFASGPRRLTSVRVYALEPGTLTLGDNAGQTRSLALGVGAPVTLATNWTQASTIVTVSFSGRWAFGLDDIATDDATGSDAGTGGTGGSDAGNADTGTGGSDAGSGSGGSDAGSGTGGTRSLAFYTNDGLYGPNDYARLLNLPPSFGTGAFTFEVWIRPTVLPVGPAGGSNVTNWSSADPDPNAGDPNWWFSGNFLLDGHDNDGDHAGTFDLQLYGGGRVRWLFHDGNQLLGVQAYPANTVPSLLNGNWHHVAAVRRFVGIGSRLELWVDGVQVAFRTTNTQPNMRNWWNTWSTFPTNERGWFFGAEKQAAIGGAYWDDYKGRVAEVRFFDAAKSATSLASDWQKAVTAATPNLVGWFRFQEGSGTVSCDTLSSTRCMTLVPRTQPIWSTDAPPLN